MSSRIEEKRAQEAKLKQQKEARSKQEQLKSAQKFQSTMVGKNLVQAKSTTLKQNQKRDAQKQTAQDGKTRLAARQGISARSQMRGMEEHSSAQFLDEKLQSDHQQEKLQDRQVEERHIDEKKDENKLEERKSNDQIARKEQGQGQAPIQGQVLFDPNQQGGGGRGSQGGQQGGDDQRRKDQEPSGAIGGIKAKALQTGKAHSLTGASPEIETDASGKIILGKKPTMRLMNRLDSKVIGKILKEAFVAHHEHGIKSLHVDLSDLMEGVSVRITIDNGNVKCVFSVKSASAKNLIESSQRDLNLAFTQKGFKGVVDLQVTLRNA